MNGILMKYELLQKVITGEKTVTRRTDGLKEINLEPDKWELLGSDKSSLNETYFIFAHKDYSRRKMREIMPRYHTGQVVYAKEAYTYVTLAEKDPWKDRAIADGSFRRMPDGSPVTMCYKLDGYEIGASWETPLFMPAWAARTFLQITNDKLERLQDITEEEAKREGVTLEVTKYGITTKMRSYTESFIELWDDINFKRGYGWDKNPWVFPHRIKYLPDYIYKVKQ